MTNKKPRKRQRTCDEENNQTITDFIGNIIGNENTDEIEEIEELEYIYFGGSDSEENDADDDSDFEP